MTMTKEWKEKLGEELDRMLVGRPYVLVVYDEPTLDVPREPWKMKSAVPHHFRSTVALEDVETAFEHARDVVKSRTKRPTMTSRSFEVEVIDQVNEGRAVWVVKDECIDSRQAADESARELSHTEEYKAARVVRVTREVVTEVYGGSESASDAEGRAASATPRGIDEALMALDKETP